MQVKEVMSRDVKFIEPQNSLQEAAEIMSNRDIGAIPVGENDRLVGFITDRDIAVRSVAQGKNPQNTTVNEAMTKKCLYCFEDDSVEEAATSMGKNQVRRLPVLNKDKRLVGIISLGDLATKNSAHAAEEALEAISRKTH